MTDEQKELVCTIKLEVLKAIVNLSDEQLWKLIQKTIESEGKGSESE